MGSVHVLLPPSLGGDGDKSVCGVRLSEREGRSSADTPAVLWSSGQGGADGCERCYLRCLRSWQLIDPSTDPVSQSWPGWPWEDSRFVLVSEVSGG